MENNKLKLIRVKEDYIELLRKYDDKVQSNSSKKGKENKPYLGILFKVNDIEYFVPISSGVKKSKLQNMFNKYLITGNKPIDIFFIEEKQNNKRVMLSVLNLNNMVPIVEEAKIYFDISNDKDCSLLRKEIAYCNKHRDEIIKNGIKIYNVVKHHTWSSLEKRCCDFKLLEEKCKEYRKNY